VATLLEILFVAPRLEHFDRKLLVEVGDPLRGFRNRAGSVLRPASGLIDRGEGKQPGQPDNANGHDLVGETDGKATHKGFLISKVPARSRWTQYARAFGLQRCDRGSA